MNILTDKEGRPITLNKIDEIFLKHINRSSSDILDSYYSYVDHISKEFDINKETPALGDVAAMCAVQGNVLYIVKMVLCELLGIEDTSSTGTEDIQTEQSKKQSTQSE